MIQTLNAFISDQKDRIQRAKALEMINEINEEIQQFYEDNYSTFRD